MNLINHLDNILFREICISTHTICVPELFNLQSTYHMSNANIYTSQIFQIITYSVSSIISAFNSKNKMEYNNIKIKKSLIKFVNWWQLILIWPLLKRLQHENVHIAIKNFSLKTVLHKTPIISKEKCWPIQF